MLVQMTKLADALDHRDLFSKKEKAPYGIMPAFFSSVSVGT